MQQIIREFDIYLFIKFLVELMTFNDKFAATIFIIEEKKIFFTDRTCIGAEGWKRVRNESRLVICLKVVQHAVRTMQRWGEDETFTVGVAWEASYSLYEREGFETKV